MKTLGQLCILRNASALMCLIMSCVSMGAEVSFLDQKKTLKPEQEWNREIVCKKDGKVRFKVTSEGPFSISFLSDTAYKALLKRDLKTFKKEGFIFTVESREKGYERSFQLKPGSYWFIIRNNLERNADVRLECFAVEEPRNSTTPKD